MYQLGYLFIELASIILKDLDIRQLAMPYLQQLADQSGETVDLAMLSDGHVVYLQVIESTQRVKIAAAVGERLPATSTATGKAFLAYLPESQVRQILSQNSTKYTERTLTSPDELLANLRETRQRGFAISEQEYETDINAVAAAIMDANGFPVAVIAVVGPSYRMPQERLQSLGKLLKETTEAITQEVGRSTLPTILSSLHYSSASVNNL
jgi:DNA-binding IclR family transcriptional regulator